MDRAGARAAVLGCAGLVLGGCAATEKLLPSPGGDSVFGNLLAFNKADPGPLAANAQATQVAPLQCPTVEVLDGTASYRTYVGADQSNAAVRYQFSMGDVARDCVRAGDRIQIKVGVEGRVLLGPAGSPGSFTVPVRIAVRRDADGKPVAAKLYQVPATIAAGGDSTDFQLVTEPIAVPFVTPHADDDYTVLVGFDAGTKAPAAAAGKGRKRGRVAAPPGG